MFRLDEFLKELDKMYADNPAMVEDYLLQGSKAARQRYDYGALLTILSELIGYYRVMDNAAECNKCAEESLEICKIMGIEGTENHATVLLNIATAYRVMGRYDESEKYYNQVADIYSKVLSEKDFRVASLYNNRSLLYSQTGRLSEAKEQLEKAMKILNWLYDADIEIAITHTNLGGICFQMGELEEGTKHMEKAVALFESFPGKKDVHYSSALSGLGEAYFRAGKFEQARDTYKLALDEILLNYGENGYYQVTRNNLDIVEEIIMRAEAAKNKGLKGMEIARQYYETYGKPMLEEKYADYVERIAVGLVGEGSECLGFDDEYSQDHDFGPGFCMWLTDEDYDAIGEKLQADYDNLPKELPGIPARKTMETGLGRVGVMRIDDFFAKYLGVSKAPDADDPDWFRFWWNAKAETLRTVTNGEIFVDKLGDFSKRREQLCRYPEAVRLQKLALALGLMAQAGQYNYPRMLKRGDKGAAFLSLWEFVDAAIDAAYLMNKIYMPFYKWKFKGMDEFTCFDGLKEKLLDLISFDGNSENKAKAESKIEEIEKICYIFTDELLKNGYTNTRETFLEVQKQALINYLERNYGDKSNG